MDFDTSLKQRVSYAKILNILLTMPNVIDVDTMMINKSNTSIDVEPGSFPIATMINIEVAK